MSRLGNLIKARREELGLSLRDFAEMCGMSHSYIRNLEDGDPRTGKQIVPTLEYLEKLAPALSMSLEEVLKEIGYIQDTDNRFEPANLSLLRNGKSYDEMSLEIALKTGERIEPSLYEAVEKGINKNPSALFIDVLAKFANVDRSFFYRKNSLDVLEYSRLKEPYKHAPAREDQFYRISEDVRKFVTEPDSEEYLMLARELKEKNISVKFIRDTFFRK